MSLNPAKTKRYPFAPRSPWLRAAMRTCLFALAVNWVMQGMRGMDTKELSFRLLAEAAAGLALLPVLAGLGLGTVAAAIASLAVAHSLGFTLNGQFWVCARYCRFYRGSAEHLRAFMESVTGELRRSGFLYEAVLIGSGGEGALGPRSDLDLRLVFPSGRRAWLRVNLLLLRLRARAFLSGVPLDAYAYDGAASLRRFDPSEPWLVVLDRRGEILRQFADRPLVALP